MKRTVTLIIAVVVLVLISVAVYRGMTVRPAAEESSAATHLIQSRVAIPAAAPDGTPITQLSALAWDKDEQLLYALSDRGVLLHFNVRTAENLIQAVEPVHAVQLVVSGMEDAGGRGIDTEDMVLVNHDNGRKGDSELFVVTEREPRFLQIRPSGEIIRELPVPAPLNVQENFQKLNQGLESLVLHPVHGLLTAPEAPLKSTPGHMHTLYGEEGTWMFERHSAEARLKAMALLENGDLLVLERSRVPASKLMRASLRQVTLETCGGSKTCRTEERLVLPEERSNFEGLTHFRGKQFFLVNDHNGKDGQGGSLLLVQLP